MESTHESISSIKRAHWLIRLRWMGVLGVLLATFVGARIAEVSLETRALYILSVVLACYNALIWTWVKRCVRKYGDDADTRIRKLIKLQIFMDLILLTLLLHFSGGIENPFAFFFVFHMIIASILLSVRESYVTAILGVLFFGLVVALEYRGIVLHHCLEGFVSQCSQQRPLYVLGTFLAFATTLLLAVYMASDIAQRRRQDRQALQVSRDYLACILDSMHEGLMVIDADFVITDVNTRMLAQCHARREDLIGSKCHQISHQADRPCPDSGNACPVEQVFRTGRHARVEHVHLDATGAPYHVELNAFPLLGPDGKVNAVVELSQDITERKQAEEALREANTLLRQKDRIKDEYVRRVTHDIKGHLGAVQTCLELSTGGLIGPLNAQQADFLGRAQARSKSLVHFLKTLLRLTEIRLCDTFDMTVFSLHASLHGVTDEMQSRAQKRSIALSCQLESDTEEICGNAVLIEEAVTHLLLNAIKYTPENGAVTVRARAKGPDLHIEVADTGMGISQEDQDRIFEEFFRASSAKAAQTQSTGLGLSIVHLIVEKHGGHIEVDSREGQGSTFRLRLPKAIDNG